MIGDGSIKQQVGVPAKGPDKDCRYEMRADEGESVLYSPPKRKKLGLIEDLRGHVPNDSREKVSLNLEPDAEDKFGVRSRPDTNGKNWSSRPV